MCGIFAAWNTPEASNVTYLGLYALQHRGQESVGIVARSDQGLVARKKHGLVADAFHSQSFEDLAGNHSIGHVRYSTAGGNSAFNIQPLQLRFNGTEIAIAHNGNLINDKALRHELNQQGAIFQSTMDTELIVHLMARAQEGTVRERFMVALRKVQGAYSLLAMTRDELFLARDPHGYRPLILGEYRGGVVAASETCAFDLIGATMTREIEPGEVVSIDLTGKMQSFHLNQALPTWARSRSRCVFEQVYFARPDSLSFGENVYSVRKAMGRELASEHPVTADLVVPVPDSGIPAALGYAEASKIPFDLGLIRNHYVHRTFIEPDQSIRNFGVKVKINPMKELIKNKNLVVIDDSIVRGTTSKKIVSMLREAGAAQVHMRVCSPPIVSPCYFGIDTPSKKELIGANNSIEQIREFLNVDSLGYLSRDGMLKALKEGQTSYCTGCFTGNYPEKVDSAIVG